MENFKLTLEVLIIILPIILFFKVWGMTKDIRFIKNRFFPVDVYQEIKVAFLKGDNAKAQEMLDTAFFNEIISLARSVKKASAYDKDYSLLVKRFDKLYYSMNLKAPDFDHYRDITNIP